jgi:hypothetical protein
MSSQVNQVITGYHEIYIYSCLIGHVFYCHFFCNFSILLSGSRWPTCVNDGRTERELKGELKHVSNPSPFLTSGPDGSYQH